MYKVGEGKMYTLTQTHTKLHLHAHMHTYAKTHIYLSLFLYMSVQLTFLVLRVVCLNFEHLNYYELLMGSLLFERIVF